MPTETLIAQARPRAAIPRNVKKKAQTVVNPSNHRIENWGNNGWGSSLGGIVASRSEHRVLGDVL